MGRNYVAFALIAGNQHDGYCVERHGMMYPPEIGDTFNFGRGLTLWSGFFQTFVRDDLQADASAVERFVKMKGGMGASAEDINLRVAHMAGPGVWLVRNVDWKAWFKRAVHPEGAPAFFSMPTEHECDAAGIAYYLASVVLPRSRLFHAQP